MAARDKEGWFLSTGKVCMELLQETPIFIPSLALVDHCCILLVAGLECAAAVLPAVLACHTHCSPPGSCTIPAHFQVSDRDWAASKLTRVKAHSPNGIMLDVFVCARVELTALLPQTHCLDTVSTLSALCMLTYLFYLLSFIFIFLPSAC